LTPGAKALIETLLNAVAGAPRSLLMLDYDGTLAPFQKYRQRAFSYPGITAVLQAIVRTGRTRVVIISGRDANEVIPLLGIEPRPEVWGLHGSQRIHCDGSIHVSPVDAITVEALAEAEQWLRHQNLLHTAEFKRGSIAVHWRGLADAEANEICRRVVAGWTVIAEQAGLHLLDFDAGVEIRSHKPNKGDAVRILMAEMSSDTPAVYLGDDRTDEHAFEALTSYYAKHGRGLSVLVRPQWRKTAAQLWLRPPEEVLALLEQWLQACQAQDESRSQTTVNA
jgi:trehalose 6-phosphate phosphatase